MAFQKYQSEQVQQIAPGFVEAYAKSGAAIGQGLQQAASSIAGGIAGREQRLAAEAKQKGELAPHIRNDQRVQVVEGLFKAGILTKAADGTAVVAADYAGKVDMASLEKNLSFYNTTGGDGSKLNGDELKEFTARYQGEQKYVADQAAKSAAQVEIDYKKAQIEDLRSKAAERMQNAGAYGAAILSTLGGTSGGSLTLPSISLPDTSTSRFQSLIGTPITKADIIVPAVAAPSVQAASPSIAARTAAEQSAAEVAIETGVAPEPRISSALAAGTAAEQSAAEVAAETGAAPQPKISAAFTAGTTPTAPKQPASKAQAQAMAPAVAVNQTPVTTGQFAMAPAAATAPAAAPAAPVTYDVPAKAAEVAGKMKAVESKRAAVRTKFATQRVATEGEIAASRANVLAAAPRNKVGLDLASSTAAFNERRLKSIADAEDRETKALDAEAEAIKSDFTNYQAAATAVRQGKTEERLTQQATLENKKAEVAAAKAADDKTIDLVQGYPTIGIWTAIGSQMTDPKTGKRVDPALVAGIPRIGDAQRNNIIETNVGYGSAQGFLLKMDDILRDRNASDNDIRDRFRLTASNMKGYFEAELASVFGVATFRKAIVSGGNFSDADREFVKSAITYLNTAAPDMSSEDLKASVNALSGFINAMYQRQMEYNGMRYAPDVAAKQAESLRQYGDASGADALDTQAKRSAEFYNRFNIKIGSSSSYSPEFKASVDAARSTLWNAMKKRGIDTSKFEDSAPNRVK